MPRLTIILLIVSISGCSLFTPRSPEDPLGEGSNWLQPDTPERVTENVQNAIVELNPENFVRSLGDGFEFIPTVAAQGREALLWSTWERANEETWLVRLKASGELFTGHSLQLLEANTNIITDDRYQIDASYQLTVMHNRTDEGIPTEVQGRLLWELARSANGLWSIERWTDQSLGSNPSWSDLKAAFSK